MPVTEGWAGPQTGKGDLEDGIMASSRNAISSGHLLLRRERRVC